MKYVTKQDKRLSDVKQNKNFEYTTMKYELEANRQQNIRDSTDFLNLITQSKEDPSKFWYDQSRHLTWTQDYEILNEIDITEQTPKIDWFVGGKLNACYNCVDKHVDEGRGEETALTFIHSDMKAVQTLSWQQLQDQIVDFALMLAGKGVQKGDVVSIYMYLGTQLIIAMLACARLGAIHHVINAASSKEVWIERIKDASPKVLVTQDLADRGGKKKIKVFDQVKDTIDTCPSLFYIVCFNTKDDQSVKEQVENTPSCDYYEYYGNKHNMIKNKPTVVESTHPLFILYTVGVYGQPRGVVHSTGGYLTYVNYTCRLNFDLKPNDKYYCTSDMWWAAGHSYMVYGPMSVGANVVLFEGSVNYPDPLTSLRIVQLSQSRVLYTSSAVIQALMKLPDLNVISKMNLKSLKIIGLIGKNLKSDEFYFIKDVIGKGNVKIVDTYWFTESGGHLLSTPLHLDKVKAGCAMSPVPGVEVQLNDIYSGEMIEEIDSFGKLTLLPSYPGMAIRIWNENSSIEKYADMFDEGVMVTNDGLLRDDDYHLWITGKLEDFIKIQGKNISLKEYENFTKELIYIQDAAPVAIPDGNNGLKLLMFVELNQAVEYDNLMEGIINEIRFNDHEVVPYRIQVVPQIPRLKDGKIPYRILRKIECDEFETIGDISALANPKSIHELIKLKIKYNIRVKMEKVKLDQLKLKEEKNEFDKLKENMKEKIIEQINYKRLEEESDVAKRINKFESVKPDAEIDELAEESELDIENNKDDQQHNEIENIYETIRKANDTSFDSNLDLKETIDRLDEAFKLQGRHNYIDYLKGMAWVIWVTSHVIIDLPVLWDDDWDLQNYNIDTWKYYILHFGVCVQTFGMLLFFISLGFGSGYYIVKEKEWIQTLYHKFIKQVEIIGYVCLVNNASNYMLAYSRHQRFSTEIIWTNEGLILLNSAFNSIFISFFMRSTPIIKYSFVYLPILFSLADLYIYLHIDWEIKIPNMIQQISPYGEFSILRYTIVFYLSFICGSLMKDNGVFVDRLYNFRNNTIEFIGKYFLLFYLVECFLWLIVKNIIFVDLYYDHLFQKIDWSDQGIGPSDIASAINKAINF